MLVLAEECHDAWLAELGSTALPGWPDSDRPPDDTRSTLVAVAAEITVFVVVMHVGFPSWQDVDGAAVVAIISTAYVGALEYIKAH